MTKVDAGRRPLGRDTSSREGRTTPHTRPLSRSTLWPRVLDVHREVAGLRSSAKQRMRLPHAHGATGASPHAIARTRMAWLCGQIPRLGPDDRADDLGRVGRGNDDIIVARMTVGYEQDRVVPLAPSADEGPPANGGDDDLTVGGRDIGIAHHDEACGKHAAHGVVGHHEGEETWVVGQKGLWAPRRRRPESRPTAWRHARTGGRPTARHPAFPLNPRRPPAERRALRLRRQGPRQSFPPRLPSAASTRAPTAPRPRG